MIHTREWGSGRPVLALHPLGLDSRAFEGIAEELGTSRYRTIAIDLPGFGETPATTDRLTMANLAEPVIEIAQRLEVPPVVMGISMGGRVALEAALISPDSFRAVVPIAPYLPWQQYRPLLKLAHFMSPDLAARTPIEAAWPILKRMADSVDDVEYLRQDPVARGGARLIYHLSCPATRWSFVSAAREMALDPAHGSHGFWERLPHLPVPATFFWGSRDRLISAHLSKSVNEALPSAEQWILRCVAHAFNGVHHRCLARAIASVVERADSPDERNTRRPPRGRLVELECDVDRDASAEPEAART